jgi:hypothetical protein
MPGIVRLAPLVLALFLGGCASRQPQPRERDGQLFGVTQGPFRERWWHLYARGVSWQLGGFYDEAERDFRRSLAKRHADSRRARTYGMHFVQYFAHRELGAVLIEQGQLDDAEREIRLSLKQEPSAKADFLLERIAALRAGRSDLVVPIAPRAAALVIDKVESAGVARHVEGHVNHGAEVWAVEAGGAKRPVVVNSAGGFATDLQTGESLVAGRHDAATVTSSPKQNKPSAPPSLSLDGPEDGRIVTDPHVAYRYDAACSSTLDHLLVLGDNERELAKVSCRGVSAAGMLLLSLPTGKNHLQFILTTAEGARVVIERTLSVSPEPAQDPRLRAVTVIAPLKSPADGEGLRNDDDEAFSSALNQDGRFRILERRAELDNELRMVEAGFVDRVTAARLGRRLKARYVVVGTLRRGRDDIECFVRLVHADSGQVIAKADAYAADLADESADAFFALVANRLRQVFPVLQAQLRPSETGERAIADVGRRHGAVVHMRFAVVAQGAADNSDEPVIESTVEVVGVDADSAAMRLIKGKRLSQQSSGVSE